MEKANLASVKGNFSTEEVAEIQKVYGNRVQGGGRDNLTLGLVFSPLRFEPLFEAYFFGDSFEYEGKEIVTDAMFRELPKEVREANGRLTKYPNYICENCQISMKKFMGDYRLGTDRESELNITWLDEFYTGEGDSRVVDSEKLAKVQFFAPKTRFVSKFILEEGKTPVGKTFRAIGKGSRPGFGNQLEDVWVFEVLD